MAKSSSARGAGHLLAKRYAVALIDVAYKSGALATIENNMQSLQAALAESSDLAAMLRNPVVGADNQMKVFQALSSAGQFHPLMNNFIGVLATNRRINTIELVMAVFKEEMAARSGVTEASVRSAHPLSAQQQEQLKNNIAQKTGKNVTLSIDVEPELLGGMIVTIGSHMIDDSVKSKLSRLKQAMTSSTNSNAPMKEVV